MYSAPDVGSAAAAAAFNLKTSRTVPSSSSLSYTSASAATTAAAAASAATPARLVAINVISSGAVPPPLPPGPKGATAGNVSTGAATRGESAGFRSPDRALAGASHTCSQKLRMSSMASPAATREAAGALPTMSIPPSVKYT